MNKLLPFLFLIFIVSNSCNSKQSSAKFYMPAEWEPHDAIWLGWDEDSSFYPPIVHVIKGLMPTVPVSIAVRSDSFLLACKKYLSGAGVDTAAVSFFVMDGERYWIRDHGAAFLVNGKGELGVADFDWNLYGIEGWYNQYYNGNKDSVQKRLAKYLKQSTGKVDSLMAVATKASIVKSDIVIEGGAIEVNGKGTLILSEAVAMQRNPRKNRSEIEEGFKKALGVSNIIWLKNGLIEDHHIQQLQLSKYMTMGTGGHTDEFVRFVDPHTILLAWVEDEEIAQHPFNKINYERMSENFQILEKSRDQDGRAFRIIKVPLPGPVERKVLVKETLAEGDNVNVLPRYFLPRDAPKVGDTLINVAASSYLNYLVSNGVIILPTYTNQGTSMAKEDKVRAIFKSVYPDREQVWVECMPQNWNGGGIHCSTQQQPKRKAK